MKKLLFICFLFVNSVTFSQSFCQYFIVKDTIWWSDQVSSPKLDSILFYKINKYRELKRLKKLVFDPIAVKASIHHTKYQFNRCIVTHGEDTLKRPGDRYKYYGGSTTNVAEVVAQGALNIKDDDPIFLEKIADDILTRWKKSPPHNAILLDRTITHGGGSIIFKSTDRGNYLPFSTFIALQIEQEIIKENKSFFDRIKIRWKTIIKVLL